MLSNTFSPFFFSCYDDHRDLHSFPTRRSSDLHVVDARIEDREVELRRPLEPAAVVVAADLLADRTHPPTHVEDRVEAGPDRKSTRLNSSHSQISYAVFCLKKKKNMTTPILICT